MTRRVVVSAVLVLASAGCGPSVTHPLDDSEQRPESIAAATAQAERELDEIERQLFDRPADSAAVWEAEGDCATNPSAPEQGEISRVIQRTHTELSTDMAPSGAVATAATYWEGRGDRVGTAASSMPNQSIIRTGGISYAVVEIDHGVELRAFLPCIQ